MPLGSAPPRPRISSRDGTRSPAGRADTLGSLLDGAALRMVGSPPPAPLPRVPSLPTRAQLRPLRSCTAASASLSASVPVCSCRQRPPASAAATAASKSSVANAVRKQ
eukprot:365910-Chlamydomonas_euryale.AAC.1